jgi:methylmalonyl-CoA/ethylmalonyl-CoA epimerase
MTQSHPLVHSLFPHAKLHHIGIALPEIKPFSDILVSLLPLNASGVKTLPEHGVSVSFLSHPQNLIPEIELLAPLNDESPLKSFVSKHPNGHLHHLCFAVGDLNNAIEVLRSHGHNTIKPPKIGAHGQPVAFIHPKTTPGILIELCQ